MNHKFLNRFILLAFACAIPPSLANADGSLSEIKKAAESGSSEAQNKVGHA